jgi:IclR family mhp operon transcriptional activator
MMSDVESVRRGLEILRVVNEEVGLTLADVASRAKLSRGTAYRMLYTLEMAGFVERRGTGHYPTHHVRCLSHGFDDNWICETASPLVHELGDRVLWPITLSEPSFGAALVRETTDSSSPFVLNATRIGFRMSMVNTASGRVLLAHFSEDQRRGLLDQHATAYNVEVESAVQAVAQCGRTFETICERGFDVLPVRNGRQTAIAVPVLNDAGIPVAALALRYFNAAMPFSEALNRFLDPLQQTARQIASATIQREKAFN